MRHKHIGGDGFRLRGTAMSRVEGFSDVVFGFALTLLVVSLEVPKTFEELQTLMRGFLPFALSFALLLMIWYAHYQFFRRYGLEDTPTIVLNACLLFVVLFYVYPLKFLFALVASAGDDGGLKAAQTPQLMLLYGVGFAAIYLLFSALYWHAWRQREEMALSEREQLLTRGYLVDHLLEAGVGALACLLAVLLPTRLAGLSGFAYFLIAVTKTGAGIWVGRKTRALPDGAPEEEPSRTPASCNMKD